MEPIHHHNQQRQSRGGLKVDIIVALVFFGFFTVLSFLLDNHSPNFSGCDAAFLVGVIGAGLYLGLVWLRPQLSLGRKISGA